MTDTELNLKYNEIQARYDKVGTVTLDSITHFITDVSDSAEEGEITRKQKSEYMKSIFRFKDKDISSKTFYDFDKIPCIVYEKEILSPYSLLHNYLGTVIKAPVSYDSFKEFRRQELPHWLGRDYENETDRTILYRKMYEDEDGTYSMRDEDELFYYDITITPGNPLRVDYKSGRV